MGRKPQLLFTLITCMAICVSSSAQEIPNLNSDKNKLVRKDSVLNNISFLSSKTIDKYLSSIDKKSKTLEGKLAGTNEKALKDLTKQEQKLRKKLARVDSGAAKQLFDKSNAQLQQLTGKLQKQAGSIDKVKSFGSSYKEYIPLLDTFKTSLKFLEKANVNGLTDNLKNNPLQEQTTKALGSIKGLESQLQNATDIKAYIKQRKQELKEVFEKNGLGKELQGLNKQAYYYQAQVAEYKQLLQDPKKIEEKAIAELTKLPLFKDFMKNNSQLASLFRVPDNYGTPQALAGLQTRASVNQLLQSRLGTMTTSATGTTGGGANPQQYIQQQVQQAQGELNKLKDKINKAGGGSSDLEIPDFKPNNQKTKSLLSRLEYGMDLQTQKQNNLFPVTSDLGLTVGYKLNDKSVVGIGASYRMGWGSNFGNMKLTNEGIGLRSYVDMKLKGTLFISGGYEQNYQERFESIGELYNKDISSWRQSGLLGLTKKIPIAKKKTTKIQLLYDLLHQQNGIPTQPLVFRVGWGM